MEGAMKSAFECFQNAAKCETLARVAKNEISRVALMDAARHWRAVSQQAKEMEAVAAKPLPKRWWGIGQANQ